MLDLALTEFTPLSSAFGGALIGLSAVVLMMVHGRIAGISGIGAAVLPPWAERLSNDDLLWRVAFIVGLLLAPLLVQAATGEPVEQTVSTNVVLMLIAGILTGFGSVFGGGCTSGHGVCGMSRLSARSIIATAVFMATAFVTVFITRHVVGG